MNWTPGPARCRSPEYEAEIAFTDMGGKRPISGRCRRVVDLDWMNCSWTIQGRTHESYESPRDLMPPTITREALADELLELFKGPLKGSIHDQARGIVAHVIEAVKSGRVE